MASCRSCDEKKQKASAYPKPQAPRYPADISEPMISSSETPDYVTQLAASVEDPCVVVPVVDAMKSSAAHTGDAPPRVTQTNIGKHLIPAVQHTEPKSKVLGDRDLNLITDKEKAWWVDKPGENAPLLYAMMDQMPPQPPGDPLFTHRSKVPLFPRPEQYELGHAKAAMEAAALNAGKKVECDCEATKPCCSKPPSRSLAKCQVPDWWHRVPFWWWGDGNCRPAPVGDINTYAIIPEQNPDAESQDLMKMLHLDRRERYIPGEIYCDEKRKIQGKGNWKYDKCYPPPPPLTAEQRSPQAKQDEKDTCENRPWSKAVGPSAVADVKPERNNQNNADGTPYIIYDGETEKHDKLAIAAISQCEKLRKAEMFKVGQPYKSAACRWSHGIYPPQHSTRIGRTPTREFPHTRLTNI